MTKIGSDAQELYEKELVVSRPVRGGMIVMSKREARMS